LVVNVKFQGAVPVNAMLINVALPLQIVVEPLITAVGAGVIVTLVFEGELVQPFAVTVTVYVPASPAFALVIVGFLVVEVNPPGPVQE
jgi:hypothetical protein